MHALYQRVQVLAAISILMFRHHLQDKGIFSCACSPPESPGTRGYAFSCFATTCRIKGYSLVHALHQRVQVFAAVRILMLRHHLHDKGIISCAYSPSTRVQIFAAVRILMLRHHLQDKGIYSCAWSALV